MGAFSFGSYRLSCPIACPSAPSHPSSLPHCLSKDAETAVAVALALLIIAYGNLLSLRPEDIGTALDWALTLGSLTFLGLLRQRTGNLAGCMVFHWLVVTAMWGTLFLMSR